MGGLTMDIKARIDALTEQEAKAALFEILDVLQSDMEICAAEICPYWAVCDEEGYDSCCAVWLGEAQKGVQK
jgi:hypothetical protein